MTETTTDIRDGHYRLGEAYLKDKQYAEAITHFQIALRLDADFHDAPFCPKMCSVVIFLHKTVHQLNTENETSDNSGEKSVYRGLLGLNCFWHENCTKNCTLSDRTGTTGD